MREFKYLYGPHFVCKGTNRAVKIPTLFVAKSLRSQARGHRLAMPSIHQVTPLGKAPKVCDEGCDDVDVVGEDDVAR